MVLADASVPQWVVQAPDEQVDRLHESLQPKRQLAIYGLTLELRAEPRLAVLQVCLPVASQIKQDARHPIRGQEEEHDEPQKDHATSVSPAPKRIWQIEQLPEPHQLDVAEHGGRAQEDPQAASATEQGDPPEHVAQVPEEDPPPPHDLDVGRGVVERHVERQQQAAQVRGIRERVEGEHQPRGRRPRVRPRAAEDERDGEEAARQQGRGDLEDVHGGRPGVRDEAEEPGGDALAKLQLLHADDLVDPQDP
mmetsp:Transcript_45268/g.137258  ORF Transcript_45268/g.137258 Transcript_45268/m.137258 type:complete len:251 (-) Transcript_45268:353-1105(-)